MPAPPCLRSVLYSVIRDGFPELAHRRFTLRAGDFEHWVYYERSSRGGFLIGVDESLLQAPAAALAGGFAHELAHIGRDCRLGPRQRARYNVSPVYRARDERETDREAVRRGFARHLLALMRFLEARGYRWRRGDGLTLPEVRALQ